MIRTLPALCTAAYTHKELLPKCLFGIRSASVDESNNNMECLAVRSPVSPSEEKDIYDRLARTERVSSLNISRLNDNYEKKMSGLVKKSSLCEKILSSIDPGYYAGAPDLKGKVSMVVDQIANHLENSPVIINFHNKTLLKLIGEEFINYFHPSLKDTVRGDYVNKLNSVEIKLMPDVKKLEEHTDQKVRERHKRFKCEPTTHNRPFYGSLYFHTNRFGSNPYSFGFSFVVLNDCIKTNCTFTKDDSFVCQKAYTMFEMKSLVCDALRDKDLSERLLDSVFLRDGKDQIAGDCYIEAQIYSRILIPEMIKELHLNLHNGIFNSKPEPGMLKLVEKLKDLADEGSLPFQLVIDGEKYVAGSK